MGYSHTYFVCRRQSVQLRQQVRKCRIASCHGSIIAEASGPLAVKLYIQSATCVYPPNPWTGLLSGFPKHNPGGPLTGLHPKLQGPGPWNPGSLGHALRHSNFDIYKGKEKGGPKTPPPATFARPPSKSQWLQSRVCYCCRNLRPPGPSAGPSSASRSQAAKQSGSEGARRPTQAAKQLPEDPMKS